MLSPNFVLRLPETYTPWFDSFNETNTAVMSDTWNVAEVYKENMNQLDTIEKRKIGSYNPLFTE